MRCDVCLHTSSRVQSLSLFLFPHAISWAPGTRGTPALFRRLAGSWNRSHVARPSKGTSRQCRVKLDQDLPARCFQAPALGGVPFALHPAGEPRAMAPEEQGLLPHHGGARRSRECRAPSHSKAHAAALTSPDSEADTLQGRTKGGAQRFPNVALEDAQAYSAHTGALL